MEARISRLVKLKGAVEEFSTTRMTAKKVSDKYGIPLATVETNLNRLGAKKEAELWWWSLRETNLVLKYYDYGIPFIQNKLGSGRSKWAIYSQRSVLKAFVRELTQEDIIEVLNEVYEKYGDVNTNDIEELIKYIPKSQIKECLRFATFISFKKCIQRRIEDMKSRIVNERRNRQ